MLFFVIVDFKNYFRFYSVKMKYFEDFLLENKDFQHCFCIEFFHLINVREFHNCVPASKNKNFPKKNYTPKNFTEKMYK